MSKAYIIAPDGETVICLDCEQNISVSRENQITSKSIMSGKEISDGYTTGLKTVNMSGIVTYSKGLHQQDNLNPIDFQRQIDSLIEGKQRFTLYTDKSVELMDDIEDCVIESCSVNLDRFLNAVTVTLSVRELWISQAATVGTLFLPPEQSAGANADGSSPTNGKGGKTEVEEKERVTILRGVEEDGRSLLGIESGL